MSLLTEAKEFQEELIHIRRWFHAHPEVSHDLAETRGYVMKRLDELGIPYDYAENGGIIARLGKRTGKSILLRADMDALPIQEKTGLPFASEHPGKMHACGHDVHMTMLLGAAKLLKQHEADLKGEVILLFQEAEEVMGGALNAINSGLLDPMPDRAFSMHVFPSETEPSGTFCFSSGVFMSSSDQWKVTVHGKSSHGSAPQNGINAITAAAQMIQGFANIARYELDPQLPAVLTVCKIGGGDVNNIIPDTCSFEGTLRMVDEEKRAFMHTRMHQMVHSMEEAYRVSADLQIHGVPRVYNDPEFVREVHDWIADLDGEIVQDVGRKINMVSEDFSEFGLRIPSVMLEILSKSPEGKHFPGHNPCVIFDEEVLYRGSAAYAQVAIKYLAGE